MPCSTASNNLSASYNFDYSKNDNQTFDVATYGNSANGIEGPSKINVFNLNFFTTLSSSKFNEFHVTYARELRPRNAVDLQRSSRHGHGRPRLSFRQSVLPAPERRRAALAHADQEQPVDGRGKPHHSKWAASGCTRSTIRSSVASSTAVTFRLGQRIPALRLAGGGGRVWSQRGGLLERHVGHPSDALPGRQHAHGNAAAALPPGDRKRLSGCRSARQFAARQRRSGAVRAGPMAGPSEPHAQLRAPLGRSADGRHRRSSHDGLCGVREQPGVSLGRHDSGSARGVPTALRHRVGRQVEPARRSSARTPACITRATTC